MKKSFTLGAVSGITALAIGFPFAAQFAGAQSSSSEPRTGSAKHGLRWGKQESLSQDDVLEMIDHDNLILLHVDAMVDIYKRAIQNHRIALQTAADMTDETERNEAVHAAHEAMRAEIQASIAADPELADLNMLHMLPGGPGKGHRGGMMKMKGHLAEKLGMTPEELKQAIDSGKTIDEIAEEKGVDLPARPRMRGDEAAAPN